MAKYTVELRDVVKSGVNIFDFIYPFYDETKRAEFEQRFIDHFYFREIGVETVGRFQHNLKVKCNERLPYYNEILKLTALDYDVLHPYSITEIMDKANTNNRTLTENGSQNGTSTGTSSTNGTTDRTHAETSDEDKTTDSTVANKRVGSDTPNGLLSMEDIKSNIYASKAEIEDNENKVTDKTSQTSDGTAHETNSDTSTNSGTITSNSNSSQDENNTASENYTLTRKGHIGVQTASELLEKQVELLQKIQTFYTQFFDECEDLFMQIY
jgi:hypothetical protein